MNDVLGLLGPLATLLENLGELKNLTKGQILSLVGFGIGGAVTVAALDPHNYIAIAAGAIAGIVTHMSGLMQQSPITPTAEQATSIVRRVVEKTKVQEAKKAASESDHDILDSANP